MSTFKLNIVSQKSIVPNVIVTPPVNVRPYKLRITSYGINSWLKVFNLFMQSDDRFHMLFGGELVNLVAFVRAVLGDDASDKLLTSQSILDNMNARAKAPALWANSRFVDAANHRSTLLHTIGFFHNYNQSKFATRFIEYLLASPFKATYVTLLRSPVFVNQKPGMRLLWYIMGCYGVMFNTLHTNNWSI